MTALDTYTFVLYVPVNFAIALVGIIGNTLAYVVMSREMEASCSTVCLKALAVADNMVLVTFSLYFGLPQFWQYLGVCLNCTVVQQRMKAYLWTGMWFSKTLSVYIIIQMTVERYIAVCMSLVTRMRYCTETAAKRGLIMITIFAFAYNLPKVFQYETDYSCDSNCTGRLLPVTKQADVYLNNPVFRIVYTKALYYVIMFIIPMSVLVVLNSKLIYTIRRARSFRRTSLVQTTAVRRDDGATEKILGVVVAFLILETPALIYNVLRLFSDHLDMDLSIDWKTVNVIMRSLYILSMINSFINLYIYCVVGKRFRGELWRMLRCRRRKRRRGSYSASRTTSTRLSLENIRLQGAVLIASARKRSSNLSD